jgi:hypothetical protein
MNQSMFVFVRMFVYLFYSHLFRKKKFRMTFVELLDVDELKSMFQNDNPKASLEFKSNFETQYDQFHYTYALFGIGPKVIYLFICLFVYLFIYLFISLFINFF